MPSTVSAPGSHERVLQRDVDEVAVQRRGHVRRVGVPVEDVEGRRVLAEQVVGDPVVPHEVVRPQPGEDAGQRAAVEVAAARRVGGGERRRRRVHERARRARLRGCRARTRRASAPRSAPARRARPGAATTLESTMPPAHSPSTCVASVPRDRLDGVERVERRPARTCPGPSRAWRSSGLRQEIANTCWPWRDRVLDHAAPRREVGDVVLVDHRRHEQQRPLAHLRGLRRVLDELEHRRAQHHRARA